MWYHARTLCLVLGAALVAPAAAAQEARDSAAGPVAAAPTVFDGLTPIAVTLTTDLRQLRGDKQDGAPWREGTLTIQGDSTPLEVRVRTRGIWRLKNCQFPPLRLDLPRRAAASTPLAGTNRPKLVTHCRDDDRFERFVLQEYQLYRIWALLSPVAHRARLLRVTYVDRERGPLTSRYAILLEEPDAMAKRLGGQLIEQKGGGPNDFDPEAITRLGVFQYMIGNTDWSVAGLHNVEIVTHGAEFVPVPYDFDWSGAVNAPYAEPDARLPIERVRQRLYRGYCVPDDVFAKVFAQVLARRDEILALYDDEIGRLLDRRTIDETRDYFEDFFRIIGDEGLARREIVRACLR